MKLLNNLLPFFLLLLVSTAVSAQKDCYQKGLEAGKKFYSEGNYANAIEAWKKAGDCRGADDIVLASLIMDASDYDGDGIVNGLDKCPSQFGAASKQGCPCFKPLRRAGIDDFYDKFYDEALRKWEEANGCEDKSAVSDLSGWIAKATEAAVQPIAPENSAAPEGKLFTVVEEKPMFPGGETEMMKFIYTNIRYPSLARENGVEGMVVVTFVVEKDGFISHTKIARDPGAGLGQEALRVVYEMPLWTPGKQDGKPVRVQFNLPVKYKLE